MATTTQRDEIYDDVHAGLTWNASENAYSVAPGTQWDDEIDGVYRNESGIWATLEAVSESYEHNLKEAGIARYDEVN